MPKRLGTVVLRYFVPHWQVWNTMHWVLWLIQNSFLVLWNLFLFIWFQGLNIHRVLGIPDQSFLPSATFWFRSGSSNYGQICPPTCFVNKVLSAHSWVSLFTYCLRLFSRYKGRVHTRDYLAHKALNIYHISTENVCRFLTPSLPFTKPERK